MQYVEMTIQEALDYSKGDTSQTVLMARQDLEKDNEIPKFEKKSKSECEQIIQGAETIARACDDFVNQMRVFSERQLDIENIERKGELNTILFRPKL